MSDSLLFEIPVATFIGALGGFIRGISGFGAALAMLPALALVIPADQAVAAVVVANGISNLPIFFRVRQHADWPAVWVILIASLIAMPAGLYLLAAAPVDLLRRSAGLVVLMTCALLIVAPRLRFPASKPAESAAGAVSGVLQGVLGLGGPPIVLYFLGTGRNAHVSRASFVSYFTILQAINIPALALSGIMDWTILRWACLMMPLMLLGSLVGEKAFHRGAHLHFRSIAIAILCVTAVLAIMK